MSKINVLDSEIVNKISAGEVIERPANVVKELVENSIDAGADRIVVEIEGGGIDKIVITDNGSGIDEADIEKAVLNHATSKISNIDDLYKIATLGFRGEALSSICAVSDVTISTKVEQNELGIKAIFANGKLKNKSQVGRATGTTIEVDGLFKYIPARLKFLKKVKTEEQEVYNIITKFILGNFQIAFKLIVDGKVKIDYFGKSLSDAIREVYGSEIANNLIRVSSNINNISVIGYVGKPNIARSSKNNQVIFVNSRYVTNQTISFGVERVFENYLMKGMHPFFCLDVNINPTLIDINVHPKKLEVRFSDPTKVFSAVYGAVNDAFLDYSSNSDLKNQPIPVVKKSNEPETIVKVFEPVNVVQSEKQEKVESEPTQVESQTKSNSSFLNFEKIDYNLDMFGSDGFKVESSQTSFDDYIEKIYNEQTKKEDIIKPFESKINVLGQIFNEFCLVSKNDTLYIIDEHAMHERLLFDKFNKETNEQNLGTTDFLEPFVLTLSPSEEDILIKLEDDLKNLGFTISHFFKNTYRVESIPTVLSELNLKTFFNKILSSEFLVKDKASLLKSKLAREACRAAVKAGKSLSTFEIEELIKNLQSGTPLLCPHGRPVVIELTKLDLEKLFKRKL